MKSALRLWIRQLAIVVIAVALISGIYIFVIPLDYDSAGTATILPIGLILAALASGYTARQSWAGKSTLLGWLVAVSISVCATVVTLLFSLFFIVNTRGS